MINLRSPCNQSYIRTSFKSCDSSICSLTCWYTNADSLINKIDEFKSRIDLKHPNIICIAEVFPEHCTYDVTATELHIVGYDCFASEFHIIIVVYIRLIE